MYRKTKQKELHKENGSKGDGTKEDNEGLQL